ncbi:uncharacterized protein [Clinocottus analis]|uniref:uncharacterized protein isoform X2 n=1 Tax=Clinocottus analis TaxID=304258 RepID=UPI0035C1E197
MQTDPEEPALLTTQSQKLQPKSFHPPATLIRPTDGIEKIQHVGRLPESTIKDSYTPHPFCPVVKATAKHLVEGFPTIKGDKRCQNFVSHYNNTFQGALGRADKPVEKECSVALGDPVKILERETTHAASFIWPAGKTPFRPPIVKERLKLNLEHFSKNLWSCTTREDFCHHKTEPVIFVKRDENFSSLPEGDTDTGRNKERMSFTTNRITFSDVNHSDCPVHASGADRMTKSHVQFSPPCLSGQYYSTTAKEHYSKQDGEPARAVVQLSSNILSGPEHKWETSTSKAHYLPLKTSRQQPCPSQQKGNIRFPLAHQHVTTTHSEHYTTKPLILQPLSRSPSCTKFLIK